MNELINRVENLKDVLDKNEDIIKIRKLNKEINSNDELFNLIIEYKKTNNLDLKKQIISNPLFNEYKECETRVNFLILEINSKLKTISNKGKCNR